MRWSMGLVSSFDLHGSFGALALKDLDAGSSSEVDQKTPLRGLQRQAALKLVDTWLNRRE
jgi:hypothetical protein